MVAYIPVQAQANLLASIKTSFKFAESIALTISPNLVLHDTIGVLVVGAIAILQIVAVVIVVADRARRCWTMPSTTRWRNE